MATWLQKRQDWGWDQADRLTDRQGRHGDRQKTPIWPLFHWSSIVYSADVIDSHTAPKPGQASPERSDAPSCPQDDQPASASTLSDSRAVIILIPVRLGGEKTNPDYFNFAKVRDAWRSGVYFRAPSKIIGPFGAWSQIYNYNRNCNYKTGRGDCGEFKRSVLLSLIYVGKQSESI